VTRERMARASFPVSSSLARSKALAREATGVLKNADRNRPQCLRRQLARALLLARAPTRRSL